MDQRFLVGSFWVNFSIGPRIAYSATRSCFGGVERKGHEKAMQGIGLRYPVSCGCFGKIVSSQHHVEYNSFRYWSLNCI